jgi:hypothetical protein
MLLYGVIIIAVVVVAVTVWYARRGRSEPPLPEFTDADTPGAPDRRDETWDPRERY